MAENTNFVSYFKINNVPILPPLVNQKEIKQIREIVRIKELKLQQKKGEKDCENATKQLDMNETGQTMISRRLSYTMTSPVFDSELLPKISVDSSEDNDTIVDGTFSSSFSLPLQVPPISVFKCKKFEVNIADKSSKDLRNELERSVTPAPSTCEAVNIPQLNILLKQLIEKQKHEYLDTMEVMKSKFSTEQKDLLSQIQKDLQVTSTPLNASSVLSDGDDEDFSAFKTCLQSQSISFGENTICNDHYARDKAATIINSHVRGYLTRKLMKTIFVQEHIRNIKETFLLVLNVAEYNIEGNPVQNISLKTKLFFQLQKDLNLLNEIFFSYSTSERMKIISVDREMRSRKLNVNCY